MRTGSTTLRHGVEAFRQLNNRFDPQTALTKSHRLKQIQKFADKNRAKTNVEVPALLPRFEDMLFRYHEDYHSEGLSDDLKKEALKELIPKALDTTIKDIIMFRDRKEDKLNSAQMRTIIVERIAGDFMNQVIRMDVDHLEGRVDEAARDGLPPVPPRVPGRVGQLADIQRDAGRCRQEWRG